MTASKSSSGGARASRRTASKSSGAATGAGRRQSAPRTGSGSGNTRSAAKREPSSSRRAAVTDNLSSLAEQLANYFINPLGLVLLTRERIQDTMDEAAERGRLTRADADELTAELVRRGRLQTEELADRARRTAGAAPSLPIAGYDELTAAQVDARLKGLTPAELRKVREYERRHVNRKSVLDAIERALD